MFDLIFNGMMAVQQVVMVIAGLICALIGGALIYDHERWVKQAKKVKATIVGMRVSEGRSDTQTTYYPVIEYLDDHGEAIRAESDSGSSSYINMEIGSQQTVFVMPDNPERFHLRGSLFFNVGLVMLVIGLGICGAAFYFFESTLYTPIVAAGFVMWGIMKMRKHIKPRSEWESVKAFASRKKEEFIGRREDLPFLDEVAVKSYKTKQDTDFLKWSPLIILIALGMIGGGIWFGQDMYQRLETGLRATGQVVEIISESDSDGTMYRSVIRFNDRRGHSIRFEDNVSSSEPIDQRWDEVTVVYPEGDPEDAIVDRGLWNWFISGVMAGVGLLMLLAVMRQRHQILQRTMRR